MIPWTDSGSSPEAPRSCTIRTYSSAYSGFPPARASSAAWTSAGSTDRSMSVAISFAVSVSESGESEIVVAFRFPPPQPGRRSSSSGRAVHTQRRGTPLAHSTRWSTKSSRPSSAHWRSSKTRTSGRRSASASKNFRHAAKISARRSPPISASPASPTSGRRCSVAQSTSTSSEITSATAARSFSSASSAPSDSRIPACPLIISLSAQKVTPSPYGSERPCRQ